MSKRLFALGALVLLVVLSFHGQEEAPSPAWDEQDHGSDRSSGIELAITLDDLPWVGPLPAGDSTAEQAVERIAAVLRVHEAPATGFVVCDEAVRNESPLHVWTSWGNTLGNHSWSHRDLNSTPVDVWLNDVRRCDEYLHKFDDAYEPYFRFPMLHQGDTRQKRDRVRKALDQRGLRTAHVSVDNSEWILTQVHARALAARDGDLRHDVGRAFVQHIVAAIEHADDVARRKLGRSVPQVLLLHANSLVDDNLDALLLELRERGTDFVTLTEALRDPAYERPDAYVGSKGLSWLYRMRPLSLRDVRWDDARADAIRERFSESLSPETGDAPTETGSGGFVAPEVPESFRAALPDIGVSERMRSLLVSYRGELIVETYFNGAGPEVPANLKSVTKTISSALVGVGLRDGWIEDLDDPVGAYLPEVAESNPPKEALTIRQLLTMSTGLESVDYGAIQQTDDWVDRLLRQPVLDGATGKFAYDTPVLQLLSAVLHRASGRTPQELAREELFGPMGGQLSYWRTDPQGLALGGNDAYLRPRDLIAFGELYLRGGTSGGTRLLPRDYVTASTNVQIEPERGTVNHGTLSVRGYGYLWWALEFDGEPAYAALGHGGQILLVVPGRELVTVITSRWPSQSSSEHYRHLRRVLRDHVLPRYPPVDRAPTRSR